MISEARAKFGEAIVELGPVAGAAKQRFFETIDIFFFPSRYRMEAQPLVMLEALSYGVATLATHKAIRRKSLNRWELRPVHPISYLLLRNSRAHGRGIPISVRVIEWPLALAFWNCRILLRFKPPSYCADWSLTSRIGPRRKF